jgi:hypothetical protein
MITVGSLSGLKRTGTGDSMEIQRTGTGDPFRFKEPPDAGVVTA